MGDVWNQFVARSKPPSFSPDQMGIASLGVTRPDHPFRRDHRRLLTIFQHLRVYDGYTLTRQSRETDTLSY